MSTFKALKEKLKAKIVNAYEVGPTLEDAEKLAGEFLVAQIDISDSLKVASMDARMRKAGLKAVRSAVYQNEIASAEKKPTENQLENALAVNELVQAEQDALDRAEVEREEMQRIFDIFHEAHVLYRQASKGRFE